MSIVERSSNPNFYDATIEIASALADTTVPYEQYIESPDGRTWAVFTHDWVLKGLLPSSGQFAYDTLQKRNDALAREFERTLSLTASLIPRFPVELAEITLNQDRKLINIGEVTAETQVWSGLRHYASINSGLDTQKEYAIVMERIPGGSIDQIIVSLGEEELNKLMCSITDRMASAHYYASIDQTMAKDDRFHYDDLIRDTRYTGLGIQLEKNWHNETWNGGAIKEQLLAWYGTAQPHEKPLLQSLLAIDDDWPRFFGEMFTRGSYVRTQLESMDARYIIPTHGDVKLNNMYRRANGQFILLDPIGDINDPEYPKLYYQQENLADLALFITDLEAHLLDTYGQLEQLADTILSSYLTILFKQISNSAYRTSPGPIFTEDVYEEYIAAQRAKLQYYCATKARVGAIGTVVRDKKPQLLRAHLLTCAMHMRQARTLNAGYQHLVR